MHDFWIAPRFAFKALVKAFLLALFVGIAFSIADSTTARRKLESVGDPNRVILDRLAVDTGAVWHAVIYAFYQSFKCLIVGLPVLQLINNKNAFWWYWFSRVILWVVMTAAFMISYWPMHMEFSSLELNNGIAHPAPSINFGTTFFIEFIACTGWLGASLFASAYVSNNASNKHHELLRVISIFIVVFVAAYTIYPLTGAGGDVAYIIGTRLGVLAIRRHGASVTAPTAMPQSMGMYVAADLAATIFVYLVAMVVTHTPDYEPPKSDASGEPLVKGVAGRARTARGSDDSSSYT